METANEQLVIILKDVIKRLETLEKWHKRHKMDNSAKIQIMVEEYERTIKQKEVDHKDKMEEIKNNSMFNLPIK